jgi:hypothetical protein
MLLISFPEGGACSPRSANASNENPHVSTTATKKSRRPLKKVETGEGGPPGRRASSTNRAQRCVPDPRRRRLRHKWLSATTLRSERGVKGSPVRLPGCRFPRTLSMTRGSTNTTPAKAPIAPAELRTISPNPNDITAVSAMNAPVSATARSAPGDPRLADGARTAGQDCLAQEEGHAAKQLAEHSGHHDQDADLGF